MDLDKALGIAASGMDAQTTRLRVIAENWPTRTPPDRHRAPIRIAARRDLREPPRPAARRRHGARQADRPRHSDLPLRYDPSNPAANADGYVKLPNVNSFVEVMDMREAERSYSANLAVMQATRSMLTARSIC